MNYPRKSETLHNTMKVLVILNFRCIGIQFNASIISKTWYYIKK